MNSNWLPCCGETYLVWYETKLTGHTDKYECGWIDWNDSISR